MIYFHIHIGCPRWSDGKGCAESPDLHQGGLSVRQVGLIIKHHMAFLKKSNRKYEITSNHISDTDIKMNRQEKVKEFRAFHFSW